MADLSSIAAEQITCIRGGRVVFRDVSFSVSQGHVLVVEGSNGSGKTSLLRMLAGLIAPAAGEIRCNGQASSADRRSELVGWLGHQDAAKPQLTPREALRFFAGLYGCPAPPDDALEKVGLAHAADLPCQYLSAGQKKRLALARLVMLGRPLWLMDEPFASLDAEGRVFATAFAREHADASGIVVIASHDPIELPCERLRLS
ncbi:MAG TPA: heme ABC exporter ATP-binding protein CcmA [Rhizomicrobium sp.]